ncbi:hypothetical protein PROFUN_13807 [Planoprotostelium fungivorum]|uniref:Uncharacterized protein n=1 Tax=Planoprotostelium fungivorum TaxID=1890364 RepID=A0A2P6N2Y6_9EUKA|nr:hypothetical protein PROFUN_13807 [Planoprotostelium fungivorum]
MNDTDIEDEYRYQMSKIVIDVEIKRVDHDNRLNRLHERRLEAQRTYQALMTELNDLESSIRVNLSDLEPYRQSEEEKLIEWKAERYRVLHGSPLISPSSQQSVIFDSQRVDQTPITSTLSNSSSSLEDVNISHQFQTQAQSDERRESGTTEEGHGMPFYTQTPTEIEIQEGEMRSGEQEQRERGEQRVGETRRETRDEEEKTEESWKKSEEKTEGDDKTGKETEEEEGEKSGDKTRQMEEEKIEEKEEEKTEEHREEKRGVVVGKRGRKPKKQEETEERPKKRRRGEEKEKTKRVKTWREGIERLREYKERHGHWLPREDHFLLKWYQEQKKRFQSRELSEVEEMELMAVCFSTV